MRKQWIESTLAFRLLTGWPTSTSRRPSRSRSPTAADSSPPAGTVRTLFVKYVGICGAKPKMPSLPPPRAVKISSGGTPANAPLRSPTASGPSHRRGTADERLRIELIADAQLAPEAAGRVLQREQRSGIAVRAPHEREEVDRGRAEVRREIELERHRRAERARAVARQPDDVRRARDVGVELAVGDEGARRPGHVAELDFDRLPEALRPGGVRLQRTERPVAVVEQHPDAAGRRQRDRDVLAVAPVEVAEGDGPGCAGQRDVRRAGSSPPRRPRKLRPARPRGAPPASGEHTPGNVDGASLLQ